MFSQRFVSLQSFQTNYTEEKHKQGECERCSPCFPSSSCFSFADSVLAIFSPLFSFFSFLLITYSLAHLLSYPIFFSPLNICFFTLVFLSILLTYPSPFRSHFSTAALQVIHFTNLKKPIICLFMTFIILPLAECFITGWLASCYDTYLHTQGNKHMRTSIHTSYKRH